MTEILMPPAFEIIRVPGKTEGAEKAFQILQQEVDRETLLLLSGGSTPRDLYQLIAQEGRILPGSVALVDERFGLSMHQQSNEQMIEETGLFDLFKKEGLSVATILAGPKFTRQETARLYGVKIKKLFNDCSKAVAIVGIGEDGHTAGILPNKEGFTNPLFGRELSGKLVGHFEDPLGEHKERITLTPFGLARVDIFIILAMGAEKKQALKRLIHGHENIEELPAMIFQQFVEEGKRVVLITDQPL